ncbi:MAG: BrnA antitoxin family protein [Bacteroidota bacterium]
MKRCRRIPKFTSEDDERKFWARRESSDYVDYRRSVQPSFPNLKPTTRTISIRIPESLLDSIRVLANRADVPYQSMMKILLSEKVAEVRRQRRRRPTAA